MQECASQSGEPDPYYTHITHKTYIPFALQISAGEYAEGTQKTLSARQIFFTGIGLFFCCFFFFYGVCPFQQVCFESGTVLNGIRVVAQ